MEAAGTPQSLRPGGHDVASCFPPSPPFHASLRSQGWGREESMQGGTGVTSSPGKRHITKQWDELQNATAKKALIAHLIPTPNFIGK